jgi:hypothetical protein
MLIHFYLCCIYNKNYFLYKASDPDFPLITVKYFLLKIFRLYLFIYFIYLLCAPGWPQTHDGPIALASGVVELLACAITPGSYLSFQYVLMEWKILHK